MCRGELQALQGFKSSTVAATEAATNAESVSKIKIGGLERQLSAAQLEVAQLQAQATQMQAGTQASESQSQIDFGALDLQLSSANNQAEAAARGAEAAAADSDAKIAELKLQLAAVQSDAKATMRSLQNTTELKADGRRRLAALEVELSSMQAALGDEAAAAVSILLCSECVLSCDGWQTHADTLRQEQLTQHAATIEQLTAEVHCVSVVQHRLTAECRLQRAQQRWKQSKLRHKPSTTRQTHVSCQQPQPQHP